MPWHLLARAAARLNDIDDILEALDRAFASGFRDLALTQEDPAFARVKSRAEFAEFMGRLSTSGDTLDLLTVERPPRARLPLR